MKVKYPLPTILIIINICISLSSYAQIWGKVVDVSNLVTTLYVDTLDDVLYIGGGFKLLDADTVFGIAKYDGNQFYRMGCGLEWDCISTNIGAPDAAFYGATSIIRYLDTIYVVGAFRGYNYMYNGLAKWDGNNWLPIGSGFGISAGGTSLKTFNNELYVCGWANDSCAGIASNGLAKYDGYTWQTVYNIPRFKPNTPNYIKDVEFYNGEIYVGGNFYDSLNGDIWRIAKYNGANWVGVGGGVKGSIGVINRMVVYDGKLYVAGIINQIGNYNGINGIAAWNGQNWEDVGGGLGVGLTQARDMKVYEGKLYVVGEFSQAGGVPAHGIAVWDGVEWCGFNTFNKFDNTILTINFYRDTMYLGGAFSAVNGDSSIHRITKQLIYEIDVCGNTTGIHEEASTNALNIYPNPASNTLSINLPENTSELRIYNYAGQLVEQTMLSNKEQIIQLNVASYPSGIYLLQAQGQQDVHVKKFVKH